MRKKIVAGNWKMNTLPAKGEELAIEINAFLNDFQLNDNTKVIIAVPFTHIDRIVQRISSGKLAVASQNCSQFEKGAYTGEVSAEMIKSLGAKYVIVGHSERRQFFGDTDELISLKLTQCYQNGLLPIFCCGESLDERSQNQQYDVVKTQLINSLAQVGKSDIVNTIIAYEPVWAIGTGQTATPEQAQDIHAFIRKIVKDLFGSEIAAGLSILYGGSVNAGNAEELFACEDIDGGLVGGASLKIEEFKTIIRSV